jgi:D-alanyl-D-alanine dipeptidase
MQKNRNGRCLYVVLLLAIATPFWSNCAAQNINVVEKTKIYRKQVRLDSNYRMVEVRSVIPSIVYDLRYGTTANFMGRDLYGQTTVTFLRLPVALALQRVADSLAGKRVGLKIFDAYRPYGVTKKMWDLVHDERYVANPAKGSGHNRGLAVDLTLIDLATGLELPMGTGFDHFSDTAHHSFRGLPEPILQNRLLLRSAMEQAGFKALETEWWHYAWPNDRQYDVLNIGFRQLARF